MSNQELQVSSLVVYGELQRARNITDKALIIEKELGTDILYTLISMGKSERDLADSLDLTEDELKLILCRTNEHRSNYIKAKMFGPATKSIEQLSKLSEFTSFDADDGRGSQHHTKIIEMFLNHNKEEKENNSAITVNNTVVVSDNSNIPEVPKELEGVYKDVST